MKIIKAARVYKAGLPPAADLRRHLEELAFTEIGSAEYSRCGFVPAPGSPDGDLVTVLARGYAFALRYDEKIVPAVSVKAEVAKLAAAMDPKPGRKQLREMRDEVFTAMVGRALHRTTVVPCFFDPVSKILIVCTVSQKLADLAMSNLVKVVGSIETTTIHIAELKNGLTTKLRDHIFTGENQFGAFDLGNSFCLKLDGEKVTIVSSQDEEENGPLREALEAQLQVESIELVHGLVSFKLSSDFVFRGIAFAEPEEDTDHETTADEWMHEAAVQLQLTVDAVERLCDLMGYQPPADD